MYNNGEIRKFGISGYGLKLIAVFTMLIDHIGYILFPQYVWLRWIGRISYPIFAFLIAEGFIHTSNLKKYISRMFIFALVTEICYDLAFFNTFWYSGRQNVLFTFTIALALLYCILDFSIPIQILAAVAAYLLAYVINADYNFMGVALVLIIFFMRRNKKYQSLGIILWNLCYIPSFQVVGALSSIFTLLYNGERGRSTKYLFYIFYPGHLLALYLIKRFLF
ncbi:MAG: TraX family protein [Suipraeoptans sp.]